MVEINNSTTPILDLIARSTASDVVWVLMTTYVTIVLKNGVGFNDYSH